MNWHKILSTGVGPDVLQTIFERFPATAPGCLVLDGDVVRFAGCQSNDGTTALLMVCTDLPLAHSATRAWLCTDLTRVFYLATGTPHDEAWLDEVRARSGILSSNVTRYDLPTQRDALPSALSQVAKDVLGKPPFPCFRAIPADCPFFGFDRSAFASIEGWGPQSAQLLDFPLPGTPFDPSRPWDVPPL